MNQSFRAEAAERDKENEREVEQNEKESQEVAAEGLLLLQQSHTTQTSPPVQKPVGTQVSVGSAPPSMYYLPCDSKLLEEGDDLTKFYTGLTSWSIFNRLVTYFSVLFAQVSHQHSESYLHLTVFCSL